MRENNKLGKLEKIELRKIWKTEDDFTKWLAKENNMLLLSKEIGIEMEVIQREASVGNFSVDILAKEENTSKNIIIENQLEDTNHDHLGKLITYASGYNANIVIWIVKNARQEHRRAIDWLNEHTDEDSNFFLVKLEIWRIEDSLFAPKFQIVSQPNDWAKAVRKSIGGRELTPLQLKELEFLKDFVDYSKNNKSTLRLSSPQISTPGYYAIRIGLSHIWVAIKINAIGGILRLDINFEDKDLFNHVFDKYKNDIENEIGKNLTWDKMPQFKISTVGTYRNFDIHNENKWATYFKWLKENAEIFQKVFLKYIRKERI